MKNTAKQTERKTSEKSIEDTKAINALKRDIMLKLDKIPAAYNDWDAERTRKFIDFQHRARKTMQRSRLGMVVLSRTLSEAMEWHDQ